MFISDRGRLVHVHSTHAYIRTEAMAERFPEIDDVTTSVAEGDNQDFLAREKNALGEEFASAGDEQIVQESKDSENKDEEEDEDFEDFKSQFPDVGTPAEAIANAPTGTALDDEEEDKEETAKPIINQFSNLNLDESEHIQEWKKTRDLEISKRDEAAARKLEDLKTEAEKAIDDFYENYNNKKDDAIAETRKEAEAFLAKRDTFLEHGTVWDRVVELLALDKNSDAVDAENRRDKSKFRDLLLALKGKESVPGAAGI